MSKTTTIQKLDALISEGNKRISEQKEDKAILILGETGAGKSTLAYLLAGKTLEASYDDRKEEWKIYAQDPIDGLQIGQTQDSETKIPTKIKSKSGLAVWDCPGFGDTDNVQDIANAFYIQRLFETTNELKFVLTVAEGSFQSRGRHLLEVVGHFVKMFKDIGEIKNSVSLVVTHASPKATPDSIKSRLDDIRTRKDPIDPQSKEMIEYLSNHIEVFHMPQKPGVLGRVLEYAGVSRSTIIEDPILAAVDAQTQYLKTSSGSTNVVISKSSEELAGELFMSSTSTLFSLLTNVSAEISKICDKVNAKSNEIVPQEARMTAGLYESLVTWLRPNANAVLLDYSVDTTHVPPQQELGRKAATSHAQQRVPVESPTHIPKQPQNVAPHYRELLHLDSILAFEVFCNIASNPGTDIQEWLRSLDDKISGVTSILKQYHGGMPLAIASDTPDRAHSTMSLDDRIKENIKYVLFLSKVWNAKNIEPSNVVDIFVSCKTDIKKAAQKGAEGIELSSTEKSEEYYLAAIKFLEKYPNNSTCIAAQSEAHYHIARIQYAKGAFNAMIASCIKSIDFNPNNVTNAKAYDLIHEVCNSENGRLSHVAGKQGILDYLFTTNHTKIIKNLLSKLNTDIDTSLRQKMEHAHSDKRDKNIVKFIDHSLDIQKSIMSVCQGQISSNIGMFSEEVVKILHAIHPTTSNKDIESLIRYLDSINVQAQHKYDSQINGWTSYFNIQQVEKIIVEMVKAIDLEGKHTVEYYAKVIEYTNLPIVDQNTKIRLDQDTTCINKRASANYKTGEIKQSAKEYNAAVEYYVKAIQLNRNLDEAYRKLDEIYFLQGKFGTSKTTAQNDVLVADATLLQKLLSFNNQVLTGMINSKILSFVTDYKGDRSNFKKAAGEGELWYLKNLTDLSQIVSKISVLSNLPTIDHAGFIACLRQISDVLVKDFEKSQSSALPQVAITSVCESTVRCNATDIFEIVRLQKQIEYIAYLGSINTQIAPSATKLIIDCAKLVSSVSDMTSSIFKHTQAIDLDYSTTSANYYRQVSEYVSKYATDKICVKIDTHAHLRLATIASTNVEKIQYYRETIELNQKMFKLCQGSDNAFYAKHSVKREACDKLGDSYLETNDIKAALEWFKLIDHHVKVKICFNKLISSYPTDHSIREQQADYFASKAMIDSAVDSYAEALSLTDNHLDHSRINKKIASTLSSVSSKSSEYQAKAGDIDNTAIVYFIDKIVYDNPLLNHPKLIQTFIKTYGAAATSRLISVTSELACDSKEEIEEACCNSNALEMLAVLSGECI